ncbi:MAG: hemolysin-type calcium-binding region, partial [Sulfitobacter sp.]
MAISNENFDGQGLIVANPSSSQDIGDWTFSMDAADQIATPNFAESGQNLNNDDGGSDRSLLLNDADASIRVFTMESTDGSDFDIASMTIGLTQVSTATNLSFEGFRDGVSVVSSEVVTLTTSDSSGNVYYSFTATTAGGSYGAITFQAAFDNVDEIRMTANGIAVMEIDDIVASSAISNTPPQLGGTPPDDGATEDVSTAIDLSAYNVSDADGDSITLTFGVDRGTVASIDGDGVTSGVTIANSGTASMTLQGTAANLNAYLNDTSKITYTTTSNETTTATLTVTPNDGTVNGTADTLNISISAVNDDPTATGVPSDIAVIEDTQSNVDLSAMSFADVDSANITVTLAASTGTFATPADGASVGAGVTE